MRRQGWMPSEIKNALYDIMDDYEIGFDLYDEGVVDAITDFFESYCPNIQQWDTEHNTWPDETGACHVFTWLENGNIQMIMFDCKR